MKKCLLLFVFILQITVAFGQKENEGATKWSSWQLASPCFPNLYISLRSLGWTKSVNKYAYNFRLKNTSTKHMHFSIDIRFTSGENYTADGRFDLDPGEERTHVSMYYDTKPVPNSKVFFTSTVTGYLENDGRDDWTVPSYSCNGSSKVCDANCGKGNSNASTGDNANHPTTASTSGANSKQAYSFDKDPLYQQELALVKEIKSIAPGANVTYWEGNIGDKREYTDQKRKENIVHLEKYLERIKADASAAAAKASAQKNAFNSSMQQGDAAMSNKNYAQAMNYYQAAKSNTSDVNDQAAAQAKYNQAYEAKRNADRVVRVEEGKKRDKDEDVALTATAASAAGAMALITDGYSSRGFAGKFILGLGYESSPILSNSTGGYAVNKSFIESRSLLTFHTGFTLGFLNNQPVSIYLKPQANLGLSAYEPGTSGGYVSYGGTGVLQLALKKHSRFNLFAEGGWLSYDGTFKYDADVANNTATDDVREGKTKYNVLRYGGGFMLRWIEDGKETYLRPAVFYDKPSFFTNATKPVLSMNLQINIYSAIILDFTYTPKTYIPGELRYPGTLEKKNVNYFGIKIIRQGKLN